MRRILFVLVFLFCTNFCLSAVAGSELSDYKTAFRDKLIKAYKFSGQGKVHAAFKLQPNGSIEMLECRERGQSTANAESIRKLISSCQPFTPAPAELSKKKFVWFYFVWKQELYSVSGPYFEESYPSHVLNSQ